MLNLSPASLDWALAHAERLGDTNIFPLPFEYSAIRHDWNEIRSYLSSANVLEWEARRSRECLSPKSVKGFRIATQLDPLDWLIYTALVFEIGAKLESSRVPRDEATVFSWRFDPRDDGTMYSRDTGYGEFSIRSKELCDGTHGSYVVVTDIADFYPRLYHHRIGNALNAAARPNTNHAKAITQLLFSWRVGQSFGLPVGPAASRLVAEIAIHDIDQILQDNGLTFVRFVDDYRIFCSDRRAAYAALATLANALWTNHGLTLSEPKTRIMPVERFAQEYLRSEQDEELDNLSRSFERIVDTLGLDGWYAPIEYDQLDDEYRARVDALNLREILDEQLSQETVDVRLTRFILRRFTQLQDIYAVPRILRSIDKLYPLFAEVIEYFRALNSLNEAHRAWVSASLLNLLNNSLVSHLEYHRMHLLSLFASGPAWGAPSISPSLLNQFTDVFTKRKVILALGASEKSYWFRLHKADWQDFSPWEQRAFLHGASSMEADERRHWYSSIQRNLDPLEKAVVNWSRSNPIAG